MEFSEEVEVSSVSLVVDEEEEVANEVYDDKNESPSKINSTTIPAKTFEEVVGVDVTTID
jgi:hypothetical protein